MYFFSIRYEIIELFELGAWEMCSLIVQCVKFIDILLPFFKDHLSILNGLFSLRKVTLDNLFYDMMVLKLSEAQLDQPNFLFFQLFIKLQYL